MMNNANIEAVIWDVGGVLVRTEDYGPREKLAERLGIDRLELERIVFGGEPVESGRVPLTNHFQSVLSRFDWPDDEIGAFLEMFFAGDRLDNDLVAFIRELRGKYRIGLLSNAWIDARQRLESQYGFLEVFDDLVFSAEVGCVKPDSRIYQLTLEQMFVEASKVVFIDDNRANIEGALSLGIHALRFESSEQIRSELSAMLFDK